MEVGNSLHKMGKNFPPYCVVTLVAIEGGFYRKVLRRFDGTRFPAYGDKHPVSFKIPFHHTTAMPHPLLGKNLHAA